MIVQCPRCGKPVVVSSLGRERLDMPLKNDCEALQIHRNAVAATNELGCSMEIELQNLDWADKAREKYPQNKRTFYGHIRNLDGIEVGGDYEKRG